MTGQPDAVTEDAPAVPAEDAPAIVGASTDFPVAFDDPADAELTWERDDMHMPFPVTPLAADFAIDVIGASFDPYYESFGMPQRMRGASWNGYLYYGFQWNVEGEERAATERRWTEVHRSRIPTTRQLWTEEVLPELTRIYASIDGIAVDDLSGEALAEAWSGAWAGSLRAWILHFISIMGPYQVLEDLADAYGAAMGAGRDAEALALIGGTHHELEDVEAGIEALAGLAGPPELAGAVERAAAAADPDAPLDLAELRAVPGGPPFVDALEAFLVHHGHLGQNHDDLRLASWAESPRRLLGRIATHLRQPVEPTLQREAELARAAAALDSAVRTTLAGRPEELAKFETILAHAREIGYLTEGHNYWIDRMSQARMRRLALRVGRRLAREGVFAEPDDVFFLGRHEVGQALRDGRPRRDLVADRRMAHERNLARRAPQYVGKAPTTPDAGDRFDGPRVTSTVPDELRGTGASAGVVRGPARLVLSQDDFGRVMPGDVIVCPSSNPSWVPVFTIAGGLVTNTGGVLSHAAVVAREFALPAVVGTGDATTRIRDGRLVEIDGTAGTVRLL